MRPAPFPVDKIGSGFGIEDGPFLSRRLGRSKAPLVVVKLEGSHVTRVRAGWIDVDGMDATDCALKLLGRFSFSNSTILLGGITFGGFNLIDPRRLESAFRTPTIVVVGARPDNSAVKRALVRHFPDWKKRWGIIGSLGKLHGVRTVPGENPLFFEAFGCSPVEAGKILKNWALVSRVPEPLRVAGLIARGLFSAQPVG